MHLHREDVAFRDGGTVLTVTRKGGKQQQIRVGSAITRLLHEVVNAQGHGPLWGKPHGLPHSLGGGL